MHSRPLPTLNLNPQDAELLTRSVDIRVEVRAPQRGLLGPAALEVVGLQADAFGLTLREAFVELERRVLVRISEVFDDHTPCEILEDRGRALPIALKLWAAHQRGELRETLEGTLQVEARPDWPLAGAMDRTPGRVSHHL